MTYIAGPKKLAADSLDIVDAAIVNSKLIVKRRDQSTETSGVIGVNSLSVEGTKIKLSTSDTPSLGVNLPFTTYRGDYLGLILGEVTNPDKYNFQRAAPLSDIVTFYKDDLVYYKGSLYKCNVPSVTFNNKSNISSYDSYSVTETSYPNKLHFTGIVGNIKSLARCEDSIDKEIVNLDNFIAAASLNKFDNIYLNEDVVDYRNNSDITIYSYPGVGGSFRSLYKTFYGQGHELSLRKNDSHSEYKLTGAATFDGFGYLQLENYYIQSVPRTQSNAGISSYVGIKNCSQVNGSFFGDISLYIDSSTIGEIVLNDQCKLIIGKDVIINEYSYITVVSTDAKVIYPKDTDTLNWNGAKTISPDYKDFRDIPLYTYSNADLDPPYTKRQVYRLPYENFASFEIPTSSNIVPNYEISIEGGTSYQSYKARKYYFRVPVGDYKSVTLFAPNYSCEGIGGRNKTLTLNPGDNCELLFTRNLNYSTGELGFIEIISLYRYSSEATSYSPQYITDYLATLPGYVADGSVYLKSNFTWGPISSNGTTDPNTGTYNPSYTSNY